jgi:hypothetical protein
MNLLRFAQQQPNVEPHGPTARVEESKIRRSGVRERAVLQPSA